MRCSRLGLALLASACAGAGAFQLPHVHAPAAGARGGVSPHLWRRHGVHRHHETAGRPLRHTVRVRGRDLHSVQASAAPGAAQSIDEAYQLLGLGGLSPAEVDGLLSVADVATAKPGAVLNRNDAITKSAYDDKIVLLLSGSATILRAGERERDLRPGDFVGEDEFLQLEVTQKLLALTSSPLEDFFRATDTDASGALDAGEVQAALRKQGIDITEGQALKLIAVIDSNADGGVSLEELRSFADNLQQRTLVRDIFLKIDRDGSGAVDAGELVEALNTYLNADFTAKQARQVLGAVTGSESGRAMITMNMAFRTVQRLSGSQSKFQQAFMEYDKDGSGAIERDELAPLLTELGLDLSPEQLMSLMDSLDVNDDGAVDLSEIEAALRRLSDTVEGRFGNVLRLFEAVAVNTRKWQVWEVVAASNNDKRVGGGAGGQVKYVTWTMRSLISYLDRNPEVDSKIKSLWATRLASRMAAKPSQARPSQTAPTSDASASSAAHARGERQDGDEPAWADYGFGGNFVYGRFGDLGPLRRALPSNLVRMSLWNFGREYRALRKAFANGEVSDFFDSLSGASAWFASRKALQESLGASDGEGMRASVYQAFDRHDIDASGQMDLEELSGALRELGVEATAAQARAMLKIADIDSSGAIDKEEFYRLVQSVLEAGDKFDIIMRDKAVIPRPLAKAILSLLESVGASTKQVSAKVETNVRPVALEDENVSEEARALRLRLKALKLDNDAVWKREEVRREQLQEALLAARGAEANSQKSQQFAEQLEATKTRAVVMIPYTFLCWTIDVLYVNRPIQRFWFLENVARMPYLSYTVMLSLYEALGWWRVAMGNRRIHFAEEWNEVQHLKIMEALGGDQAWIDRFLGRHAAILYFLILNHIWLVSPSLAYNFSELIEFHAVDTYGEFVDANKELLKSLPPPIEALEYYNGNDMYLFDEFQTGRAPRSRRPQIRNLYDVFCNIRDDELEHVKTMFQCQTALETLESPNELALRAEASVRAAAVEQAQDQRFPAKGEGWEFPSAEDAKESQLTESVVAAKKVVADKISEPEIR